jgi:hypothetical protein
LQFLLSRENGELMSDFERRANNIVGEARRNATGVSVEGANNPEGRGPRIVSGQLHDSIQYEIGESEEFELGDGIRIRPVEIFVFTDTSYAFYLETGLRNGRTYPFLTPALDAAGE